MSVSNNTLVVDAGNTNIKWTWFTADGIAHKWSGDVALAPRDCEPDNIVLASVRSKDDDIALESSIAARFPNVPVRAIQSEREVCGVKNSYAEPERLGVDRWLAAVAAYHEYPVPCVIVDAGTAIKVDFVDAPGIHLGGYIVPGLELMESCLVAKTAKIRYQQNEIVPASAIPHSTATAVSQGCLEMALGFLERLYEKHGHATWLVTGGAGYSLMSQLNRECIVDEHLVAKGAKRVFDAHRAELE